MRNLDESRKAERDRIETERIERDRDRERPDRPRDVVPFEQQRTTEQRTTPVPADQNPLLPKGDMEQFQSRWTTIQAGFVDEPRKTLEEADKFVDTIIQRTAQLYTDERKKLEGMWRRDQVSTEDLRIGLQRYRAFFSRLLTM